MLIKFLLASSILLLLNTVSLDRLRGTDSREVVVCERDRDQEERREGGEREQIRETQVRV